MTLHEGVIEALRRKLPSIPETVPGLKRVTSGGELAGPCPKCGGRDRFYTRPDGSWGCRQCGCKGGDHIDLHQWIKGTDIKGLAGLFLDRPEPKPKQPRSPAKKENLKATYSYRDENGAELFRVMRFEKPGHSKVFIQCRVESGKPVYNLRGVRRVLYRLPEVIQAGAVVIVEGEKDVDNLTALGIVATTSPGGAGGWKPEFSESLRGKDVVIVPDKDDAGRGYENDVLSSLAGKVKSMKVLHLPGPGKDVSDWIQAGGTADQLYDLIGVAEEVKPEVVTEPGGLFPVDVGAMISTVPEKIPFLIKNRMPAGRGILITGLGGSSKTRLLYQLSIGSIVGWLSFPWEVERTGRAVLVLTEDTENDVHRTIFYMVKALSLTDEEKQQVTENLTLFPLAGHDFKILTKGPNGVLSRTPAFFEIVEKIKALGNVVFLGIDPALGVTEGDELDQNHQRTLGKAVDDMAIMTGATCALVAHATKASLGTQELSSHNSRGGGAITDAVRAEYSMRNMTGPESLKVGINDPEERRRYVQLCATKGNALPPSAFVPVWLRRDDSGTLFESELEFCEGDGPRLKDFKLLELLVTPLNINDWRVKAVSEGVIVAKTDAAQKKELDRARHRLEKSGLIEKGIGRGFWTRTDGKDN